MTMRRLIDTLNKSSVSECRNKFAVASDADKKISTANTMAAVAKWQAEHRKGG
jgi:hypothetical protein